MTALDRVRCELQANVVVRFDTFDLDESTVLKYTKRFREQITALGVTRAEFLYIINDSPASVVPRRRERRYVALTPHAEAVFALARP